MDIKDTLQWQAAVRTEEEIISRIRDKGLGDHSLLKGSYVIQNLARETIKTIPRLELVFHDIKEEEVRAAILDNPEESLVEIADILGGKEAESPGSTMRNLVVKSKINNISSSLYLDIIFFDSRDSSEASLYWGADSSNKEDIPLLSGEDGFVPISIMYPEGIFMERLILLTSEGGFADSMEPYFDLLCMVSGVCLEGRKLGDYMRRFYSPEKLSDFKGLKGNKGLVGRWRAYAREKRLKVKDFPELIERILQVISPVAEAVDSDLEFFGTWMPELSRYIG